MNMSDFPGVVFYVLLFGSIITAIFHWLWNITMPQVFGLKEITFWIAMRLLLIAGFLTSGIFFRITGNR
ncbi:MAG TPA: hypothetical protein VF681_10215 [Abditibacteriaceae bacterium]|jgi:hypothetical protein